MQRLERGVQVCALGAKQDRISIWIGDWIYEGDDTELLSFARAVSEREWPSLDGSQTDIMPFTRFQRGRYSQEVKFTSRRRGGGEVVGAPLVAGSIEFKSEQVRNFGSSVYRCRAMVTLNPTRALVHQPVNHSIIRAFRRRNPDLAEFRAPVITTQDRAPLVRNERPINPTDDNVIIDRHWLLMSEPNYWREFKDAYIGLVALTLHDLVHGTFRDGGFVGGLTPRPQFNLKEVETYWEFRCDDPIRMVNELETVFRGIGSDYSRREYDNVAFSQEIGGNIPTLSVHIVQGAHAVLYPKTTHRIRLELRHDLTRFTPREDALRGGHVFERIEEALRYIDYLADNAAQHANHLLDVLTDGLPPAPEPRTAYQLVAEVLECCDNKTEARMLLSILINQGSYRVQPRDPLRQAVRQLLNRDVLMRTRPNGRTYALRGHYRAAADLLATNVTLSGLDEL